MAPFSTLFYREQMEDLGNIIEQLDFGAEQELQDSIDEMDEFHNVKVTVIDGDQNVIYTSRARLNTQGAYWQLSMELFNSSRKKIENGDNVFKTRRRPEKNNQKTIQLIMIRKVDENRYVVISRSYQSLQNAMYSAIVFDLTVGIFIVFLGWLVVYRLSRYMIIPIQKMKDAAERISNLEFDTQMNVTSEDEIGQLSHSINKMSQQLERDMTQLQKDIESRKRLVRNLSHEIKSPIAVIMGYSDRLKTIISKNPEKALEYCEIISNESTRIDMLVKEMLEISKMEQEAVELNKEKVKVSSFFESIKKHLEDESMGKIIAYEEYFDASETIYADYILLERAVVNLIRNALIHGPIDHMTISVTGERKEEFYEIKVYNSGSHIADDEISSIWEPFNKVDKVRTRGKTGYGVGLTIVKEIVEAHEGYCSVQNTKNGVEFAIAIKG